MRWATTKAGAGKGGLMKIDLQGQVAMVTGAGNGIGRCIATSLAAQGVRTAVLDVNDEALASVDAEFAREGWDGIFVCCDVRDLEQVEKAVAMTIDAFGQIDIVVNNAGVALWSPVDTLSKEHWDLTVGVNLTGTFHLCKAVIPHMKARKRGRIINSASYAAITPSFAGGAYAASKAGVYNLTRVLAGELGPWNITANCFAPGMIPTGINHYDEMPDERQQGLLDLLALRRWGKAEEIAELVIFLASDSASYITGALLEVTGGKLAIQQPAQAYEHFVATEAQGAAGDDA